MQKQLITRTSFFNMAVGFAVDSATQSLVAAFAHRFREWREFDEHGVSFARYESKKVCELDQIGQTVDEFVLFINALGEDMRSAWFEASRRDFVVSIASGYEPDQFDATIPDAVVAAIASVGGSLTFRVLAHRVAPSKITQVAPDVWLTEPIPIRSRAAGRAKKRAPRKRRG